MTVIEAKRVTSGQRPEQAIFVAPDGRRARRVRRAAFVAAFLACLWVVGLGVGMVGFGSLPGVSVVKEQIDGLAGGTDTPGAKRTADRAPATPDQESVSTRIRSRGVTAIPQGAVVRQRQRQRQRARSRPAASRPVSRPPLQATAPPPAAQQPVNPAQRTRGWARSGETAPPGQTRKATPPPPPATRGQRRGQTQPTTPPPVPPGQEKKALLPPPPPLPKKA
jgi:hypothetical protein